MLAVICLMTTPARAQLQIGLTGGLNVSKSEFRSTVSDLEIQSTSDYFVGVSPGVSLADRIYLFSDILYSRRGHKFAASGPAPQRRYHFIDVVPQVELRVLGLLGATAGFHYGIKLDEEGRFGSAEWEDLRDFEGIDDSDLGFNLGARLHLGSLVGFVRYNRGVKSLGQVTVNDASGNLVEEVDQYLHFWQMGLSFIL